MAEADRVPEEGETTRIGASGLVVRVQLRRLQPDPYPETAGAAERVKKQTDLTFGYEASPVVGEDEMIGQAL